MRLRAVALLAVVGCGGPVSTFLPSPPRAAESRLFWIQQGSGEAIYAIGPGDAVEGAFIEDVPLRIVALSFDIDLETLDLGAGRIESIDRYVPPPAAIHEMLLDPTPDVWRELDEMPTELTELLYPEGAPYCRFVVENNRTVCVPNVCQGPMCEREFCLGPAVRLPQFRDLFSSVEGMTVVPSEGGVEAYVSHFTWNGDGTGTWGQAIFDMTSTSTVDTDSQRPLTGLEATHRGFQGAPRLANRGREMYFSRSEDGSPSEMFASQRASNVGGWSPPVSAYRVDGDPLRDGFLLDDGVTLVYHATDFGRISFAVRASADPGNYEFAYFNTIFHTELTHDLLGMNLTCDQRHFIYARARDKDLNDWTLRVSRITSLDPLQHDNPVEIETDLNLIPRFISEHPDCLGLYLSERLGFATYFVPWVPCD